MGHQRGAGTEEFTHNESLQTLDLLVAGAVEEPPTTTPPASPSLGACYIAATGATGAWAGMAGCLVGWTTAGWRAVSPWELGTVRGTSLVIDGQQVVGGRQPAIASPSGGSVIDAEGRDAISAILDALRQHGLIET